MISELKSDSRNKLSVDSREQQTCIRRKVKTVSSNSKDSQSTAIHESVIFNASHGSWNIDGGQRTAALESLKSNASYGTWNIDGGQRTAV